MEQQPRNIRVVIADDHGMFRQGVREMLGTAEDLEVAGEAADGEEAVAVVERAKPDVVLLDVEMPVLGAEEAMLRMLEVSPPPRVVIVTMHDEPRLVRWFMEHGASAYLVKSASLEELLSAVRAAVGSSRSPDEEALVLPREVLENMEETEGLSKREREILLLAARGMSNRRISGSLHLAEATVKRHLANVYARTGANSRTEAARMAISKGWISSREVSRELPKTQE